MELNIRTASIAAACLIAATKDIRYYLNGVHIKSAGGFVTVQSTNGSMGFENQWVDGDAPTLESLIIPLAIAKEIGKVKTPQVTISGPDEAGRYTCGGRIFNPIEGRYPDMARVIPQRDSAKDHLMANHDFEQLAICQKAMRTATGIKGKLWRIQNAENNNASLIYREEHSHPLCLIAPFSDKPYCDN